MAKKAGTKTTNKIDQTETEEELFHVTIYLKNSSAPIHVDNFTKFDRSYVEGRITKLSGEQAAGARRRLQFINTDEIVAIVVARGDA